MITITEKVTIKATPAKIFHFLTHIDVYYQVWHPRDHRFCKSLTGSLGKTGSYFHFLEIIGGFPLYLITKITKVKKNEYLEYQPAFPFSLLAHGKAFFHIEKKSPTQSILTAYVEYGDRNGVLDKLANRLVKTVTARKHIRQEGEYLKQFTEQKSSLVTVPTLSISQNPPKATS